MVVLIVFSKLLSWNDKNSSESLSEEAPSLSEPDHPIEKSSLIKTRRTSYIVTLSILFSACLLFQFYSPDIIDLKQPLNQFPDSIAEFSGRELLYIDERIRPLSVGEELVRSYEDAQGRRLDLYIAYFSKQDHRNKVIDYRRTLLHEGSSKVVIHTDSGPVAINRHRGRSLSNSVDTFYWYQLGTTIVKDEFHGRFVNMLNTLFRKRNDGAVIVVQSRRQEDEVVPFLEKLLPLTQFYLSEKQ